MTTEEVQAPQADEAPAPDAQLVISYYSNPSRFNINGGGLDLLRIYALLRAVLIEVRESLSQELAETALRGPGIVVPLAPSARAKRSL